MKIFPLVMAGGHGTRLWPLSRPDFPKPFLSFNSSNSLLQDTLLRISGRYEDPCIICAHAHRFLVAEHLREIEEEADIILEPQPGGTAFAIAVGALRALARDPNALVLVMPSDHKIDDVEALNSAIAKAAKIAVKGNLVVLGANPQSPDTGYGYICAGETEGAGMRVQKFVEKPDTETAAEYFSSGAYFWNSGIFIFSARHILEEIKLYTPDIYKAAQESWAAAVPDLDFIRLPEEGGADFQRTSIDYAVLEKSKNICMVELDAGWSDIGTWKSLWGSMPKDAAGNAVQGRGAPLLSENTLIFADDDVTVAALGVRDMVIIARKDSVLVASFDQMKNMPRLVNALNESDDKISAKPKQVWRPWGKYEILDEGPGYLIKRLTINAGSAISMQYHNHRAEHWVVNKGRIKVDCNDKKIVLGVHQSFYIPKGCVHRITNMEKEQAEVIEVQTGPVLEEGDIVRLDGDYAQKKSRA